jgi:hypothetical protein
MNDITKCTGDNCPVRMKCFRFNSAPSPLTNTDPAQFLGKKTKDKFACEYFYKKFEEFYAE